MLGKVFFKLLAVAGLLILLPVANASDGYNINGQSGIMHFVSIDPSKANDEDVYRLAVAKACAGKPVCQVHFWLGDAPSSMPFTDAQVNSKLVNWQQNLNTGLRRWLVSCQESDLFNGARECM